MQIWNLDVKQATDLTDDSPVCPTSYMEIHELLGTSGCSKEWPYWSSSVMGVIQTPKGKLAVSPGDRLMRINDDWYIPLPPYLKLKDLERDKIRSGELTYDYLKSLIEVIGPLSANSDYALALVLHCSLPRDLPNKLGLVDDILLSKEEIHWTNRPDFEGVVAFGILDLKYKRHEGILQNAQYFMIDMKPYNKEKEFFTHYEPSAEELAPPAVVEREKLPEGFTKLPGTIDDHRHGLGQEDGYYFYPKAETIQELDLIEISKLDRASICSKITGNYILSMTDWSDESQSIDAQCFIDNYRTPTHKTKTAKSVLTTTLPLLSAMTSG